LALLVHKGTKYTTLGVSKSHAEIGQTCEHGLQNG